MGLLAAEEGRRRLGAGKTLSGCALKSLPADVKFPSVWTHGVRVHRAGVTFRRWPVLLHVVTFQQASPGGKELHFRAVGHVTFDVVEHVDHVVAVARQRGDADAGAPV